MTIGPNGFRRLSDLVFRTSKGETTFVSLADREGQTARFANNQVVQNVHTRKQTMTVEVSFGSRSGRSSTTDLKAQGIVRVVQRAEENARHAPEDPEFLPPLPPQAYPKLLTNREETADARPWRLMDEVKKSVALCKEAKLEGAGVVSAYGTSYGIAASTGLFAHERRSRAEFSLTATGPDSSGWVKQAHRSIDELGVEERTHTAIAKAQRSASPKEIPAGKYTVILEPAAVAGLLGPVQWAAAARGYHRGTSALSGKLGQEVIDPRLTLRNAPRHPALLGNGFSGAGLASDEAVWVDKGVLKRLNYDRWTAREHETEPSYPLEAPHLSGESPASDLVGTTERGILVTNFWYIRFVNPGDLTLTGMTRDGTFLVEDGKITTGLVNFRFHESPLRAFNQIDAYGPSTDAITTERTKMWLPAMRIRDFNFSSVTRF